MDLDENFRICEKWAKVAITRFSFGTGQGSIFQTQKLLVDFDDTLRPFQKCTKLQVTNFFFVYPDYQTSIRKMFRICNLECPNSKSTGAFQYC